jgi:hypothetical protein
LAVGAFDLAENVVGAAAYRQMSLIAPDTAQTLFGPQAAAFDQTVVGVGRLGWDAANGVAYQLIAPLDAGYAQEAYGANLDRLQQVGLNATGGANIGGAERFTYTLTQILLPVGIAKGATLGRLALPADAADVARLDAVVVTEANAQRAALTAGEAAEVRTVVTEATADSGVQGVTTPGNCTGAAKQPLLLKAPSTTRVPRDMAVNPAAPLLKQWQGRTVGGTPTQQQALLADIQDALAKDATDIRVNQEQVNGLGQHVGKNRPDLQYTLPDGTRVYIEYDNMTSSTWPNTPRGPGHGDRTLANDPNGVFIQRSF